MADLADISENDSSFLEDVEIKRIRNEAAKIPKGEPGYCGQCEEYFQRIVDGQCGRCRDIAERKRKNRRYE